MPTASNDSGKNVGEIFCCILS